MPTHENTKKISSNSRTKDSRFASRIETFYSHHPIRRRVRCANCLKSIWNVKIYGIRSQNLSKESLKIESESPLKREHAICDNPDRHTEEDWAWEESRFFFCALPPMVWREIAWKVECSVLACMGRKVNRPANLIVMFKGKPTKWDLSAKFVETIGWQ